MAATSTIRGQLTRMVLIPSVSFLVLWTLMTAAGTVQAVAIARAVADGRSGTAAYAEVLAALREERRLSQIILGAPGGSGPAAEYAEQRDATDRALAAAPNDGAGPAARTLQDLRGEVGEDGMRSSVLEGYSAVIADIAEDRDALLDAARDGADAAQAAAARDLGSAAEEFSHAEALLAGAIAADALAYQETSHFTYLTASYRDTLDAVEPELSGSARTAYARTVGDDDWSRTEQLSRDVVTRAPVTEDPASGAHFNTEVGVDAAEWRTAASAARDRLDALAAAQLDAVYDGAQHAALERVALAAGGAALTLLAGAAAIFAAGRSARRLTSRLGRLRAASLETAGGRLPDLVARASGGRRVDVDAELPRLAGAAGDTRGRSRDDELTAVAAAFDTAQRTAVGAAVKQAEIREGANRVFLGIAYRNQALVQRQLRLLDEIEYAEDDPQALKRLFRLDHLATRARRYADNLIILGGAHSARRWRGPLPMVDVLRAGISETEDYERVRLTSVPDARLRGTAVADVVHLVAELVENATQFSPAGTPVDVHCATTSAGIAVGVEDRGLGMTEEGYAEAARTLADAPEFDVMALPDEPRLGLFVVARLAARHGIAVRLTPSPYGGTRATAVLPHTLLESGTGD
ncbi:sensor histidine kinase [Nocardiopsis coralliicola]